MTERAVNEGNSKDTDGKSEKYVLAKDIVIQYYKEHDKVLVIDDFHYASKAMQTKMAQQLKDAIRRELKVVVVSLPHRADDAIRQNADLSGRLSLINIEAWEKKDLKEIALKGFKQLDIKITDEVAEQLAVECLDSSTVFPDLEKFIKSKAIDAVTTAAMVEIRIIWLYTFFMISEALSQMVAAITGCTLQAIRVKTRKVV